VILFIVVFLAFSLIHLLFKALPVLWFSLLLFHHKSNYIWHPVLLKKAYRNSTKTLKLA